MATEVLVRVMAPDFVAGLIMGRIKGKNVCVRAAPILKWCVYKSADDLRAAFHRNGWKAVIVSAEHTGHE